jgi:hypothetical protein
MDAWRVLDTENEGNQSMFSNLAEHFALQYACIKSTS